MSDLSISDISNMLADKAESIAADCIRDGRKVGGEWAGDLYGKVSVRLSGEKAGVVGFWAGQGPGSNSTGGRLLDLIWLAHGCSGFGDAVKIAKAQYLGIDPNQQFTPEQKREWAFQKERRERERAQRDLKAKNAKEGMVRRLWSSGVQAANSPVELYLAKRVRGFQPSHIPPSIRYRKQLQYDEGRSFDALIAGVQRKDRKLSAIWRIYLTRDGYKAPVENPKLGKGIMGGGGVRLAPVRTRLAVCEGIETGFGVMGIVGAHTSAEVGVVAALSTSGMMNYDIPDQVKHLDIYADGDLERFDKRTGEIVQSPGLRAAEKLAEKAEARGIQTEIHEPPAGSDWLDVWNSL